MLIGAHVPGDDPLGAAAARGADCVQVFLSDPQGFKMPKSRPDAEDLRATDLPIYVHAPYLINPATTNNRVRHPSRQLLQKTCVAAANIGAEAVIVHGGHLADGEDPQIGFDNWRKTFERLESEVPVYLENTAGGDNAMARHFDRIAGLWEAIAAAGDTEVGFCLDTCHTHAAGEKLVDAVERIRAITGRIDLVHLNDSKDEFNSGRDRHENLGHGEIDPECLVSIVKDAGAPVIIETPDDGDAANQADDIAWIRGRL